MQRTSSIALCNTMTLKGGSTSLGASAGTNTNNNNNNNSNTGTSTGVSITADTLLSTETTSNISSVRQPNSASDTKDVEVSRSGHSNIDNHDNNDSLVLTDNRRCSQQQHLSLEYYNVGDDTNENDEDDDDAESTTIDEIVGFLSPLSLKSKGLCDPTERTADVTETTAGIEHPDNSFDAYDRWLDDDYLSTHRDDDASFCDSRHSSHCYSTSIKSESFELADLIDRLGKIDTTGTGPAGSSSNMDGILHRVGSNHLSSLSNNNNNNSSSGLINGFSVEEMVKKIQLRTDAHEYRRQQSFLATSRHSNRSECHLSIVGANSNNVTSRHDSCHNEGSVDDHKIHSNADKGRYEDDDDEVSIGIDDLIDHTEDDDISAFTIEALAFSCTSSITWHGEYNNNNNNNRSGNVNFDNKIVDNKLSDNDELLLHSMFDSSTPISYIDAV